MTTRCVRCFRPEGLCFCKQIPKVNNRTSVLILQHRRERFHRFNTARIVHQSLQRCDLLVEHTATLIEKFAAYPLSKGAGLLYPSKDAKLLSELGVDELPEQLVVIDGTWNQTNKLMREIPRLRTLPRYSLAPTSPSRYRIRREPNAMALSTLEATIAALQTIEPETNGFDRLEAVFDQMVDNQLLNPKSNWRKNAKRGHGVTNSPRSLLGDLNSVVVGYGEQQRGGKDADGQPDLIYWSARRLGSDETFECAIESPSFDDPDFLKTLNLSQADVSAAVTRDDFSRRWRAFLREEDVVAVYQQSTANLLQAIDETFQPNVILKSISVAGMRQRGTLEEVLQHHAIQLPPLDGPRAKYRRQCAEQLVMQLRESQLSLSAN